MAHDPLSPSEALRTRTGATLAVVSILTLVYSLVIVGQVLFGLIVGVALPASLYLSYRLFAALDALADAAQRIADARDREADEAARFDSATERDAPSSQSSDRLAERER
ncbi:hypothetical protein [Halorubrum lipolyticum]|uniref:Uncharacterized protein n=1 Tax=Halorubrum lipolyticum DSM 21995 TaxID=1227482 RepID=M0P126_9EURY|nr:hypothetical protein [Halorubrum lipolyticum]EMA63862.1 hypothetical protein C469_01884 [Halorubrum lipolyticum DSM 21995]